MSFAFKRTPLLLVAVLSALALAPTASRAAFSVGLQDATLNGAGTPASVAPGYQAIQSIGGSVVRLGVAWSVIAGATPFNQTNPSDPHYRWTRLDEAIQRAAQNHLQVLLMVYDAPAWAEGPAPPVGDPNVGPGSWEPNALLFGQFMHALAQRYDGNFPDPASPGLSLPRVKYFEIWNETNLSYYVSGPDRVDRYRSMLRAGYNAVKSVHSDNVGVFAGLAPIAPANAIASHPVSYFEQVLCIRPRGKHFVRIHSAGCKQQVRFDAVAVHPYTLAATPTKPANNRSDILVPNVGKLNPVMAAAKRLHTINSGRHPILVTEWSWFTDPPQTQYGDPPLVAARYVDYSMYEFWKAGVSMVVWQTLADVIGGPNPGGGLESTVGVAKPTMTAFGFPFIASVKGKKGYGWGRAPVRNSVKVIVQRDVKNTWRRVAGTKTDGFGVFQVHFKARGNGIYRAVVVNGTASLPYYSAKIPPKRTHAYSFG